MQNNISVLCCMPKMDKGVTKYFCKVKHIPHKNILYFKLEPVRMLETILLDLSCNQALEILFSYGSYSVISAQKSFTITFAK